MTEEEWGILQGRAHLPGSNFTKDEVHAEYERQVYIHTIYIYIYIHIYKMHMCVCVRKSGESYRGEHTFLEVILLRMKYMQNMNVRYTYIHTKHIHAYLYIKMQYICVSVEEWGILKGRAHLPGNNITKDEVHAEYERQVYIHTYTYTYISILPFP